MKMMKWALLGSAAIAVTATVARADDLTDLKAQIEALQTRVSQLEAQPQAAMPSGYSLMGLRDGQGTYETFATTRQDEIIRDNSGFTLSVLPTADAAPVAEVSVSGEIRTALIYSDVDIDDVDDDLDINVRGRIFVRGKADTAVGEVGGYFRLEAAGGAGLMDGSSADLTSDNDYVQSVNMNKAYGWWKFAPNWELMAGANDNVGALQVGWDWMAATGPVASFGPSNVGANEQMRLTYSSGPLSFAVSVEDPDNYTTATPAIGFADGGNTPDDPTDGDGDIDPTDPNDQVATFTTSSFDKSDLPNLQAYLMYSSDAFTAMVSGVYQDDDYGSDDWAIGGGANIGIAQAFTLTAGVVVGEGTSLYSNNLGPLTTDDEFWAGSVGLIVNISEDTRLELGAGIEDYDLAGEATGFGGGIYWDPVSQLTLGIGATYIDYNDLNEFVAFDDDGGEDGVVPAAELESADDYNTLQIFFGTWFRFP